jgi:transposase
MARPGPRSIRKYSDEFKLTAVQLSQQPGIQVRTVAASLAIHPVMLSKWRKDVRERRLTGRPRQRPGTLPTAELARLQELERDYALLKEEHELLKKAIRFCSARSATRSRSLKRNGRTSA